MPETYTAVAPTATPLPVWYMSDRGGCMCYITHPPLQLTGVQDEHHRHHYHHYHHCLQRARGSHAAGKGLAASLPILKPQLLCAHTVQQPAQLALTRAHHLCRQRAWQSLALQRAGNHLCL